MVAIGSGESGDERLCVGVPGRLWLLLWPFTEYMDCCCGGGICWSRAMGVLSTAIAAGSGDGEVESQLSCNTRDILSYCLFNRNVGTLTHNSGRVTQICVFNTVKLGTSASSP